MNVIRHFVKLHSVYKYNGMFPEAKNIQDAINLVLSFRIKSEIIGNWLYCFTNPLIGYQLEAIGFWYSFKHHAYIFSDGQKEVPADEETLDEIRARLGSQLIRN